MHKEHGINTRFFFRFSSSGNKIDFGLYIIISDNFGLISSLGDCIQLTLSILVLTKDSSVRHIGMRIIAQLKFNAPAHAREIQIDS